MYDFIYSGDSQPQSDQRTPHFYTQHPITNTQAQVVVPPNPPSRQQYGFLNPRNGVPFQNHQDNQRNMNNNSQYPSQYNANPQDQQFSIHEQYQRNQFAQIQYQSQFHFEAVGLPNIGNSCYMNSVFQALFSISQFVYDLRIAFANMHKLQNEYDYLTFWLLQIYDASGQIGNHMINLLTSFKQLFSQRNNNFRGSTQQDAQEFLNLLLNNIHSELHSQSSIPILQTESIIINFTSRSSIRTKYNDYLYQIQTNGQNTVVNNYFGGIQINSYFCQSCKQTKFAFEQIMCLTAEIEKDSQIIDSISRLFKEEIIEKYHCDICHTHSTMIKRCKLIKIPLVLIIDLKRYKQDSMFFNLIKTNNYVKDHTELKVQQQICLSNIMSDNRSNQGGPVGSSRQDLYYQLKAVVDHHGSEYSGHYTCLVRQNVDWSNYDDTRITQMYQNDLNQRLSYSETSYILLYTNIC